MSRVARGLLTLLVAGLVAATGLPTRMAVAAGRDAPEQRPTSTGERLRIPPDRQVELALSAAPPEISQHATVYVLQPTGYVKTRTGTNGFSCLVEHQYLDTYEPICYDAEGSATILEARLYRERLRASGLSEAEVAGRIARAYKGGKLKAPRKPGFAYMMARDSRLFDPFTNEVVQGPPHLMFYAPYARSKDFGGFVGMHAPFVLFEGQPDTFIIVVPGAMVAPPQPQDGEGQGSHAPGR